MLWFSLQEEEKNKTACDVTTNARIRVSWVPEPEAGRQQWGTFLHFDTSCEAKLSDCVTIIWTHLSTASWLHDPLASPSGDTETGTRQEAPNQQPVRSYVRMDKKITIER